jgi:rare lipoprotein A
MLKLSRFSLLCGSVLFILSSMVFATNSSTSASLSTKKSLKKHLHHRVKHNKHKPKPHSSDYMTGIASCYAHKFVGRKTTSGDVFVMNKFTGAHPTLPMRTKLKVTDLNNGKSIYIEVNDRMARSSGHVIDLPWLPAEQLGLKCPYITKVHLTRIDNEEYRDALAQQSYPDLGTKNESLLNEYESSVVLKETQESVESNE